MIREGQVVLFRSQGPRWGNRGYSFDSSRFLVDISRNMDQISQV